MTQHVSLQVPRIGMFATVRNRRGITTGIEPFDGPTGRLHLVNVEYKDDQYPREERLIWELEPEGRLLEPTALPDVISSEPMPAEDFDALLRATRWSAATPFIDPDGKGPLERLPIASPFHGAVQVDDFQLVPLLKALRMPRVSLLLADDVGLGKTIEAGLILTELLLRRRVQRVLVLTPASLRMQWRDEMWDKFSLPFDLVDREQTHSLRRRLGMDANPWRSYSRIIASYHYLRQPDVLDEFLAACRTPEGSPHLPWDLLIVDECHNLMPAPFGEDSDLCTMLRTLTRHFEHRLFLSATPHNGHTRSFSGLLEILDPVRFSQTTELTNAMKERVQQIVVRRLKREINERTNPPRFCTRLDPRALVLQFSKPERELSSAFAAFRSRVHTILAMRSNKSNSTGSFAIEILGKRLLSSSVAFANTWHRLKEGFSQTETVKDSEVLAVKRSLAEDTGDDRETQARTTAAAGVIGAWLTDIVPQLNNEIAAIDAALDALGLHATKSATPELVPLADARYDALEGLIERLLRTNGTWREEERLVVFTEYKTTLDYLMRRLAAKYGNDGLLTLYGGMDDAERLDVRVSFNDPSHSVRILVATDAASEGLNLQRTARYMLHFDCPWNPSRIEQRNGRIDRHGQARDVEIFHFVSDEDQDLNFLAHVIHKANEIREDLGSANEIFDKAAHRRLIEGESAESVKADLDRSVRAMIGTVRYTADNSMYAGMNAKGAEEQLTALAAELDLHAVARKDTLEAAMAVRAGRPQLDCSSMEGTCRVVNTDLAGWTEVIDESLRRPQKHGQLGPVARLAFDASPFLENIGGRMVFGPKPDIQWAHLSHPIMQHSISTLIRRRFPGTGEAVSRWTVRRAALPADVEALILLSVEELAVNDLRETFHHWVRTIAFPLVRGRLGAPMPHVPVNDDGTLHATYDRADHETARDLAADHERDLKRWIEQHGDQLTSDLRAQLAATGKVARADEEQRYRSRLAEVSTLIEETTIAKLEREIEALKVERAQGLLFDQSKRLDEIDRSIEEKREEMARRVRNHEEVRAQLDKERDRILKNLLPKRHSMAGAVQVFPVSIEVRLPGGVQ